MQATELKLSGGQFSILWVVSDGKLEISTSKAGLEKLRGSSDRLADDSAYTSQLAAADVPDKVTGLVYADLQTAVPFVLGFAGDPGGRRGPCEPEAAAVGRGIRHDERGHRASSAGSSVSASVPGLMAARTFLFSSESVTEGHPDKMADQISDSILDAVLAQDPMGRVACETLITTGLIVVAGEISTECYVDIPKLARNKVREIGYDRAKYGFDADTAGVIVALDEQSPDIAQGVDASYEVQHAGDDDPLDQVGAGDQGMMFGYATNETEELMPLPIMLAHKLCQRLAAVRKADVLPYLRPDGKAQVTIRYEVDERRRPAAGRDRARAHLDAAPRGARRRLADQAGPGRARPAADPAAAPVRRAAPAGRQGLLLLQPDRQVRRRRADGRHRPDRAQDHRRHVRRLRAPRRRRLLGQGPDEGRPLGGLRGALRGEEPGRRRPRRPLRGERRLRDRRRAPGVDRGADVRHRARLDRQDRAARPRALRPAPGRDPARPRPAPADLLEDGRVRPLRPRRPRLHVGAARQGRRAARGGRHRRDDAPPERRSTPRSTCRLPGRSRSA